MRHRGGLTLTGVVLLAAALLLLGGCGRAAAPPPGPRVSLVLDAPLDLTRVSSAMTPVSGTVHPARASVEVLGHHVRVAQDGTFSTQVALAVGTNLIDIEAAAPRSVGAIAAVRVIRFLLVTVPDLSHESPAQATAALRALGLRAKLQSSSSPFNFLIPESAHVCSSTPIPGARVDPATTVTLQTAKICGL